MLIRFALVAEGTSDHGLVRHLEDLCVRLGASEATGEIPPFDLLSKPPGKTIPGRLSVLHELCPDVGLVFVHRDADSVGSAVRRAEIEAGIPQNFPVVVPVIPIAELEAWLLLDERALFAAVGRPLKSGLLDMPKSAHIESLSHPKELLKTLLAQASGKTGKRLARVSKDFAANRRFLIERLEIDGPVRQLAAWLCLMEELRSALAHLGNQRKDVHLQR